jgi:hypothetical protein
MQCCTCQKGKLQNSQAWEDYTWDHACWDGGQLLLGHTQRYSWRWDSSYISFGLQRAFLKTDKAWKSFSTSKCKLFHFIKVNVGRSVYFEPKKYLFDCESWLYHACYQMKIKFVKVLLVISQRLYIWIINCLLWRNQGFWGFGVLGFRV